jgi:hypothetical protein
VSTRQGNHGVRLEIATSGGLVSCARSASVVQTGCGVERPSFLLSPMTRIRIRIRIHIANPEPTSVTTVDSLAKSADSRQHRGKVRYRQ